MTFGEVRVLYNFRDFPTPFTCPKINIDNDLVFIWRPRQADQECIRREQGNLAH